MPDFPEPLRLVIGDECNRLYTVKHGGYKQVLSGRVQTPTLVVDRLLQSRILNQTLLGVTDFYRDISF
jgi:DNA topoisomerase-3